MVILAAVVVGVVSSDVVVTFTGIDVVEGMILVAVVVSFRGKTVVVSTVEFTMESVLVVVFTSPGIGGVAPTSILPIVCIGVVAFRGVAVELLSTGKVPFVVAFAADWVGIVVVSNCWDIGDVVPIGIPDVLCMVVLPFC